MNLAGLFKKTTALALSSVFAMSYARADINGYSATNTTALATCQQKDNCSKAQKAQIKAYEAETKSSLSQGQAGSYCNGSNCSKSQLNSSLAQQQQEVSNANAAAYQNGVNAANGGTLTSPTYSTNEAANGSGTSAGSGNKGMIVMVASAGAAVATATVLKAPCKTITSAAWACPLMAIALVQVGASLLSSKGSGASRDALTGSDSSGSGSSTSPTNLGLANGSGANDTSNGSMSMVEAQIGSLSQEAADLQKTVDQAGYKASPDGSSVTGPNGKKTNASAFSSPSSMSDAGFSDSQISAMDSTMDAANQAANDKFKKIAGNLTNDTGGGGKGSGGSESGGSGGGGSGFSDFDPNGLLAKNAKAKGNGVAGMSKKFGSDNIGVAGDNIFEMITRRYQARDKANNFIVERTDQK